MIKDPPVSTDRRRITRPAAASSAAVGPLGEVHAPPNDDKTLTVGKDIALSGETRLATP